MYLRKIEARWPNHSCHEIEMSIAYSQCVYVTFVFKH